MSHSFEQIKDDFAFLEDWEDRYRYIIELGRELPPLSDNEKNDDTRVQGCVSQVWLITEPQAGTEQVLKFRGESDAHIVRGLVAIVLALYSGKPAQDIAGIDAVAVLKELGLDSHLSPQRANGLRAMVQRIHADASKAMAA